MPRQTIGCREGDGHDDVALLPWSPRFGRRTRATLPSPNNSASAKMNTAVCAASPKGMGLGTLLASLVVRKRTGMPSPRSTGESGFAHSSWNSRIASSLPVGDRGCQTK